MSETGLLGAVVRRLVHDVANPLAAAQMLAEDADPLLRQSIDRVADLLALYRAIFGGNPDDAIDEAALWRRLAATIEPATLSVEIAPEAPTRALKAAAALVLGVAGRGPVLLSIAADSGIRLSAERPGPSEADPATAFAEQLAGPFIHQTGIHQTDARWSNRPA